MREKLWVSSASSSAMHYFCEQILNRPFGLLKQKYFIGNDMSGRNLLII